MGSVVKRSNLLEARDVSIHCFPSPAICWCETPSVLLAGCDNGDVQVLDKSYQQITTFPAHAHKTQFLEWLPNQKYLMSVGTEEAAVSSAMLKFWDLDNEQGVPNPKLQKVITIFNTEFLESEVTAVTVKEVGAASVTVAVGLASGCVYVLQGDASGTGQFEHSQKVVVRSDAPSDSCKITGLQLLQQGGDNEKLTLSVSTESQTLLIRLNDGLKAEPAAGLSPTVKTEEPSSPLRPPSPRSAKFLRFSDLQRDGLTEKMSFPWQQLLQLSGRKQQEHHQQQQSNNPTSPTQLSQESSHTTGVTPTHRPRAISGSKGVPPKGLVLDLQEESSKDCGLPSPQGMASLTRSSSDDSSASLAAADLSDSWDGSTMALSPVAAVPTHLTAGQKLDCQFAHPEQQGAWGILRQQRLDQWQLQLGADATSGQYRGGQRKRGQPDSMSGAEGGSVHKRMRMLDDVDGLERAPSRFDSSACGRTASTALGAHAPPPLGNNPMDRIRAELRRRVSAVLSTTNGGPAPAARSSFPLPPSGIMHNEAMHPPSASQMFGLDDVVGQTSADLPSHLPGARPPEPLLMDVLLPSAATRRTPSPLSSPLSSSLSSSALPSRPSGLASPDSFTSSPLHRALSLPPSPPIWKATPHLAGLYSSISTSFKQPAQPMTAEHGTTTGALATTTSPFAMSAATPLPPTTSPSSLLSHPHCLSSAYSAPGSIGASQGTDTTGTAPQDHSIHHRGHAPGAIRVRSHLPTVRTRPLRTPTPEPQASPPLKGGEDDAPVNLTPTPNTVDPSFPLIAPAGITSALPTTHDTSYCLLSASFSPTFSSSHYHPSPFCSPRHPQSPTFNSNCVIPSSFLPDSISDRSHLEQFSDDSLPTTLLDAPTAAGSKLPSLMSREYHFHDTAEIGTSDSEVDEAITARISP